MIVSAGVPVPFAPQALAEVSPIASATGYFYADQGLELLQRYALYGQLFRSQPWVYAVSTKLAKSASRLPINVWDRSGDDVVRDETSAYAKFWQRPSTLMSRHQLIRWTWNTRKVYGEAFWYKVRADDGRVLGVFPMHPSRTLIERNKDTGRVTYRFTLGVANAGILEAPQEDVVPFQDYNPDNIMRGLSPLEPLRATLYNEDAARRATEAWWKRGARPSLMVSAPSALSQTAYDRLKDTIADTHGGADAMGGTLLLEEGAKPIQVQLTAEEMQYIESRKLNRGEVCGVYDVPPPVVHILDDATFSNITEQMRSMYRDTMTPDLDEFESVVAQHLEPDFDPSGDSPMRFNLDDVLRGDFETRAKAVGGLVQVGVMKPAEGRDLFELPDAGPEADRLYANATIQPLGYPAERVSITAGTTSNPLPLTEAEQAEVGEALQHRDSEPKKRTCDRAARRAAARRMGDTEDEA